MIDIFLTSGIEFFRLLFAPELMDLAAALESYVNLAQLPGADAAARVQALGNSGEQILREMKKGSLLLSNFITASHFQLNLGQASQES